MTLITERKPTNSIPEKYSWLLTEKNTPRILIEALAMYGICEFPGQENNPVIIEWAKEVGGWIGQWYDQDAVPWCGLFIAVCAKRAGVPFNQQALAARSWVFYGSIITEPALGDIMIFGREGGGHVALYVGEDEKCFHVLGGNQKDMVCITRIEKNRLLATRRPPYPPPAGVRKIFLAATGAQSENEV